MDLRARYDFRREGDWDLWVLRGVWTEALWKEALEHLERERPADHPKTRRFFHPPGEQGTEIYLKIYYRSRPLAIVKDLCRDSKAFRALKQGEALSRRGFHVPLAIAAGEERKFHVLKRAFLLTAAIEGAPLPLFLGDRFLPPLNPTALRRKREQIRQLALEIRRMHEDGFVHGDLVPTNILARDEGDTVTFFYMDNDRTRRYPRWMPQGLWKRNLIQLNRFVLSGISLQDRMRFLRSYLGEKAWGEKEGRLLRWIEAKTRKRRRECDQVEAEVSFRELMRWNGHFTRNIHW